MKTRTIALALVAALALWAAAGCASKAAAKPAAVATTDAGGFQQLWVYVSPNLADDESVGQLLDVMREGKRLGVTHVIVKDPKAGFLSMQPPKYFDNIKRVRQTAEELGLTVIPMIFPFGYSGGYLMHDPNLAAGLPVKDAPFVVTSGVAKPDPRAALPVANGGFEGTPGGQLGGWAISPDSVACVSLDPTQKASGETSLKMADFDKIAAPAGARGRGGRGSVTVSQNIRVEPFKYYRLSIWRRTAELQASSSTIYIGASDGTRQLCYTNFEFDPTQDWIDTVAANSGWRQFQLSFNTLEARSIEIRVGISGATSGAVWWDDLKIEPAGLANVLRRPIKPLVVKSEDGQTTYVEGVDFQPVVDPKLGHIPSNDATFPELPFDIWHEGPGIVLTPDSRIKDGDTLLVSYYHPQIIYGQQIIISMEDPKTYELMDDQMKRMVDAWHATGYLMNHDEIRIAGWEEPWDGVKRTPGEILAYNMKRSVEIAHKYAPKATLYTWSDMFDPNHNARHQPGRPGYYLCNGDWYGSWKTLPSSVAILTWVSRPGTLKFFSDRGNEQILCGYYDSTPGMKSNINGWMTVSKGVPGVVGMMYTTWTANYKDMPEFFRLLKTYDEWKNDPSLQRGGRRGE